MVVVACGRDVVVVACGRDVVVCGRDVVVVVCGAKETGTIKNKIESVFPT